MLELWLLLQTPKVVSCLENVTVSKGLEELAREVARVQGQAAGKEEDSVSSDESGPLPVPKSTRVVSGRRLHHLVCRDGKLEKLFLEL